MECAPFVLSRLPRANIFKNNLLEDRSIAKTFDCIEDFNTRKATIGIKIVHVLPVTKA